MNGLYRLFVIATIALFLPALPAAADEEMETCPAPGEEDAVDSTASVDEAYRRGLENYPDIKETDYSPRQKEMVAEVDREISALMDHEFILSAANFVLESCITMDEEMAGNEDRYRKAAALFSTEKESQKRELMARLGKIQREGGKEATSLINDRIRHYAVVQLQQQTSHMLFQQVDDARCDTFKHQLTEYMPPP